MLIFFLQILLFFFLNFQKFSLQLLYILALFNFQIIFKCTLKFGCVGKCVKDDTLFYQELIEIFIIFLLNDEPGELK